MSYLIQVFRTEGNQFYWRLKRKSNGKILAHSENYTRKEACRLTAVALARDLQCEVYDKS